MTNSRQNLGHWGESQAAAYLTQRGYTIVGRNVRTPYGEIDIVALREEVMIFVEVKTRTSAAFGLPEDAITPQKRSHIINSARAYLQAHHDLVDDWRIDVIAIQRIESDRSQIVHFENAITG